MNTGTTPSLALFTTPAIRHMTAWFRNQTAQGDPGKLVNGRPKSVATNIPLALEKLKATRLSVTSVWKPLRPHALRAQAFP